LEFGKDREEPVQVVEGDEQARNGRPRSYFGELARVQLFEDAVKPKDPVDLQREDHEKRNVPHGNDGDRDMKLFNPTALIEPFTAMTAFFGNRLNLFTAIGTRLIEPFAAMTTFFGARLNLFAAIGTRGLFTSRHRSSIGGFGNGCWCQEL